MHTCCRGLEFNPGDLVLLSTKNLRQPGPGVRKLKPSYMGPFEVDNLVGNVAVNLKRMDAHTQCDPC